jgi:hypothetical protein
MENNDESIKFQSNFKRARVEVDLSNLPADPDLRIFFFFFFLITILATEIKFEEHIYKKNIVNHLTMIFHKHNLEKHGVVLIQHDSKNMMVG